MRKLIRCHQTRQASLAEMQAMIDAGLGSGPAQAFDMQAFITEQKCGERQ
ncbi:hypothetical protein [Cypionkella sp. TWP1-2-1b2]